MKKLFGCALAWLLCLSLCAVPALAEYDPPCGPGETGVAMAYTPIHDESLGQITNMHLASAAIDGWVLGYGESFSFNEAVGERSKEEGYRIALNGRGSYVRGGGVSQVATTLNLAAMDCDWVTIDEYMSYDEKFTGNYVDDGTLAVVTDYANDHDYSFTSWYPGVIVINAWIENNTMYCSLSCNEGDYSYDGSYSDDYEGSEYVLATGVTPLPNDEAQRTNIEEASLAISGYTLEYGDVFSFNDIVGPRTAQAGYVKALNGRGVRVVGGGVAQVASTVYLAAKQVDCVTLDYVRTYGDRFTGGYVDDPDDAVVTDYNAGIDFFFIYYGAGELVVSVYENGDELICELYEFYD